MSRERLSVWNGAFFGEGGGRSFSGFAYFICSSVDCWTQVCLEKALVFGGEEKGRSFSGFMYFICSMLDSGLSRESFRGFVEGVFLGGEGGYYFSDFQDKSGQSGHLSNECKYNSLVFAAI